MGKDVTVPVTCIYLFYICDFLCDCFVTVVPWPSMTFHHILFCDCFVTAFCNYSSVTFYHVLLPSIVFVIDDIDRKSTRLNSSHLGISYAVFCLKKKNKNLT